MKKVVLYISAFVPMYILFLLNLIMELVNKNLSFNITNSCVLIGLIVLTLIGTVGLMIIINNKKIEYEEIKIVSKKNLTDQHFLNYFSLFVLLALAFDLSKISFVSVFVVILIFIGIVYIKNNIFYINPLLNIMGYSFYDITYIVSGGEEKETRIFYKGKIDLNKYHYEICVFNRNLNFLRQKN